MTTFLSKVLNLIELKAISKNKMLTDLHLGKNSFINWESRGTIPNGETLQKIADYFGVSVDYLLNGSPEPAVVVSDNVLNNVNGDNNINVTLSDDEQILNMIRDLDLVQKSKVILAIDEIRKGN